MRVNKKWFLERMAARGMNQAEFAKAMGLDPSAMSRMLKGGRAMQLHEAGRAAEVLNATAREVMIAAGIDVRHARADGQDEAPIVGRVMGDGSVQFTEKPLGHRPVPAVEGSTDQVLRMETLMSPLEPMMGWHLLLGQETDDVETCLGDLCVCTLPDRRRVLRWVRRGYSSTTYLLIGKGAEMEESHLHAVQPVVAILTR